MQSPGWPHITASTTACKPVAAFAGRIPIGESAGTDPTPLLLFLHLLEVPHHTVEMKRMVWVKGHSGWQVGNKGVICKAVSCSDKQDSWIRTCKLASTKASSTHSHTLAWIYSVCASCLSAWTDVKECETRRHILNPEPLRSNWKTLWLTSER